MSGRRRWAGIDLRELPWRVTAELDPLVHLRRAGRLLSGQSQTEALATAGAWPARRIASTISTG